ncbi:NAD-dependent succinate-semialdehyde dehydrogenase [Oerskovia turbata]|uniref:NAD-dependent succinate-semialdehyde dehydrogenase n=1 Tax=Oerskovia turbata TaxID=1713 RepID=A0A4Q1KZ75_9CELL|nr:NAD-dependent succinate-semialdehyde dehydrogenase [Oerskovia turbata]RXR27854.1 NAD-dependent succinate-semialdehyde dehydrogenase [Oerskovia turbata]RXR35708.1 NAD-dependent succinate-semialdehyde dehydrogenase [Oerskovia turbata]TGJ96683.1 NAD-dependent succinate-semialdehyde dehydrogenase [Actinotalea fermentans ATCC 43279 = JCM 9966 = DSM 3133]
MSPATNALSPALVSHLPTGLLIGGQWGPAEEGRTFEVADPATEEVLFDVSDASPADGLRALEAAHAAAPAWRAVAPRERSELLRAVFATLTARADDIAALITAECGKPLAEARAEVVYGAEFLRWYAEQAVRTDGLIRTAPGGANRQLVSRRPVGPALLITPWNFPIAMATRKIGPALAAGCTVVIKPAHLTPLTTSLVAEIIRGHLEDRGLPTGVVNVVPTSSAADVTNPLLADRRLRKLSFTGSTGVGRTLLKGAADHVLRTSMELGGNAPFLVFADADLDAAVEGALVAKLRNTGQSCVAANRFLVHDAVARDFGQRLARAFGELRVGPGSEEGVQVGPLIEAKAVEHVDELVAVASDEGAQVLTGGDRPRSRGHFYSPTVLTGVDAGSRVVTEEIFGPVAPIVAFADDDEGIALANDTEYGLAAYAYTRDLARAMRVGEEIDAGMIGINRGLVSDASAPFGGMKQSGLGREGGEAGLEEYLETVYVAL